MPLKLKLIVYQKELHQKLLNLYPKVIGEEDHATPNAMGTGMICNNLKFILEDCFDSSTLNHISPTPSLTPSPKPSPENTPSPVHNKVQLLEHVMDSLNLTPIIQILESVMSLVDYEHPTGETTDDQNQLTYFSDSTQPPPLNTMFGSPIDVSSGKASSSSSSESYFNPFPGLNLKPVILTPIFIKPIQVVPLQTFTPKNLQNDQACSAETTYEQNNLSLQFEVGHVTINQPELEHSPKPQLEIQPEHQSTPQPSSQPTP